MTEPIGPPVLDLIEQRRIALDAEVDLRTLKRALSGEAVKPSSEHRIRRVLAARGLLDVLPPQPEHAE